MNDLELRVSCTFLSLALFPCGCFDPGPVPPLGGEDGSGNDGSTTPGATTRGEDEGAGMQQDCDESPYTSGAEPAKTESSSSSSAVDVDTSTGDPRMTCGDGLVDPGEDCDGSDLAGMTCADVDPAFHEGTLSCDARCSFDFTRCLAIDNPIHVCQEIREAITDHEMTSDTIVVPIERWRGTIVDIDVEVELDHTYIGDLFIDVLTSDRTVRLHDQACSSQDDLHVIYDDQAAAQFDCPNSDAGYVVMPSTELADFNGDIAVSDWTLVVSDERSGDIGTLDRWCLTITWI